MNILPPPPAYYGQPKFVTRRQESNATHFVSHSQLILKLQICHIIT
jgi:hypothetical protein